MMLFNGVKVEVEEVNKDGKGAVVRFLENCYIQSDTPDMNGYYYGYHFKTNEKAYVPIDKLKSCNYSLADDYFFSQPSPNEWMMEFKPIF